MNDDYINEEHIVKSLPKYPWNFRRNLNLSKLWSHIFNRKTDDAIEFESYLMTDEKKNWSITVSQEWIDRPIVLISSLRTIWFTNQKSTLKHHKISDDARDRGKYTMRPAY